MNFKTLYDLTAEKINYFSDFLSTAYMFFAIGIVLLVSYKINQKPKKLLLVLSFTIIPAIVILVFLGGQFLDVRTAKKIMQSGNYFVGRTT